MSRLRALFDVDAMTGMELSNICAHTPLRYTQRPSEREQREHVLLPVNHASMAQKVIIETSLAHAELEAREKVILALLNHGLNIHGAISQCMRETSNKIQDQRRALSGWRAEKTSDGKLPKRESQA